jgi:hypothetical protein
MHHPWFEDQFASFGKIIQNFWSNWLHLAECTISPTIPVTLNVN